ncbi:hypothetical protein JCM3766R1_002108 [Sporobolomyces carnicolor]
MTKLAHLSLVALALSSLASARPLRLEPESPACPITLTACPSSSSGLLECIDTQSDVEQCGGCQDFGGIDCTTVEGVETAGCVEGTCEVWACARGFDYLLETKSCVPAYP